MSKLESLDDILAALNDSTARRSDLPEYVEPVLPKVEDYMLPTWLPPVDTDKIRAALGEDSVKPKFNKNVKHSGSELSKMTYLKGKVLNEWVADRCVRPKKAYEKFVKGADGKPFKPYRFHRQPELIKTWKMDLYADSAQLYWLDQPNTAVDDCGTQFQALLRRHMPKREQHLYPIYYAQKKYEEEQKRVKKREKAQMVEQNVRNSGGDDETVKPGSGGSDGGIGDKWKKARSAVRLVQRLDKDTTKKKKVKKRSAQEEAFFKDSRVRHLDPFKYVNRSARQLGLSHPYQVPTEELELAAHREAAKQPKVVKVSL